MRLPSRSGRDIEQKLSAISTAKCPFADILERGPGNSWSGGMTPDVARWLTWPCPMAVDEAEALIARCLEQIEAGAAFHFVVAALCSIGLP